VAEMASSPRRFDLAASEMAQALGRMAPNRAVTPVDRPCWVTTGDLRRDLGLIVPGLASRPRITVYWDRMPR